MRTHRLTRATNAAIPSGKYPQIPGSCPSPPIRTSRRPRSSQRWPVVAWCQWRCSARHRSAPARVWQWRRQEAHRLAGDAPRPCVRVLCAQCRLLYHACARPQWLQALLPIAWLARKHHPQTAHRHAHLPAIHQAKSIAPHSFDPSTACRHGACQPSPDPSTHDFQMIQ